MNHQEELATTISSLPEMVNWFMTGFDDSNRAAQASSLPNHPIWTLGHCALYLHRVAEEIDGQPLPEIDFVTGDGTAGDAARFDTESVCFMSEPSGDASRFPTMERGFEVFAASCEHLAGAIRAADDAKMNETVSWGGRDVSKGYTAQRMVFHVGVHMGQILDLRRSLGFEALFKPQESQTES